MLCRTGLVSTRQILKDRTAGVAKDADEGLIELAKPADVGELIRKLGKLRVWAREEKARAG